MIIKQWSHMKRRLESKSKSAQLYVASCNFDAVVVISAYFEPVL